MWKHPDCALGSSEFHNFRINDPAILIQSSYFITDFKESKSTKKKKFLKGPNLEKNDFAFISLHFYVKKYLNNFFATISVKNSQNPNFRNLENFLCE